MFRLMLVTYTFILESAFTKIKVFVLAQDFRVVYFFVVQFGEVVVVSSNKVY